MLLATWSATGSCRRITSLGSLWSSAAYSCESTSMLPGSLRSLKEKEAQSVCEMIPSCPLQPSQADDADEQHAGQPTT